MKNNLSWFSIIEVVVASFILSLSVFWVYKLIWENTKLIWKSYNYMQANFLFQPMKECIEKIWYDSIVWTGDSKIYIDLWTEWDNCSIWTNTSVLLIDNLEYQFFWEISNTTMNSIDWILKIDTLDAWIIQENYQQKKR